MPTLRSRRGAAKPADRYHHGDLRTALLQAGRELLTEVGPAALSLRELARRLGVSHNAPYKHFATREALLAALAAQGFAMLGERTRAAVQAGGGMEAMGLAYVAFALSEPAIYRLMFSDTIDKSACPDLKRASLASYEGLRQAVARIVPGDRADAAATSAWALVHGLSLLLLDGQIPSAVAAGDPLVAARRVLRSFTAGREPGKG